MADTRAKRCFLAIPVDEVVTADLAEVLERVELPGLRPTPPRNMHLTIKFLGNVEDPKLPEVIEAARQATGGVNRFELDVTGFDYLPGPRRPRVLAADLTLPDDLATLAEQVETAMEAVGFPRESRAFRPHITVGRFKLPKGRGKSRKGKGKGRGDKPTTELPPAESLGSPDTGCTADRLLLMQSVLHSEGPEYTTLAEFPFG